MPAISRFYGIVIKMFSSKLEHNPPHIHALYAEYIGVFNIVDLKMIQGDLPIKAQKLVLEWIEKNKKELLKMWNTQEFTSVTPLE